MKSIEVERELYAAKRFHFDRITGDCSFRHPIEDGHRDVCFWRHIHREIEMIYIEKGAMHVHVMDEHLRASAGDLLIFNPYTAHFGYVDDALPTVAYTFFRFDAGRFSLSVGDEAEDMAAAWGASKVLVRSHIAACPETERIGALMGELVRLYHDPSDGAAYEAASGIYSILSILQRGGFLKKPQTARNPGHFLKEAARFLEENYAKEITPELIYSRFPYSRSYFCRLWKRNFGITFSTSLSEYRIHTAIAAYINNPECALSIGEIAGRVGFTDYCQFSTIFRKIIGCSPRKYRQEVEAHPTTTTAPP